MQQYEARQGRRNRRRGHADSPSAAAAGSSASDGSNTPTSSSGSHALEVAAGAQQQQHVELTAIHAIRRSEATSPAAGWGASRPFSPWPQMDAHRAPSPAAAGLPGHTDTGDAVMALTMLPAAVRPGRLPPLQQPQHGLHTVSGVSPSSNGHWLLSLAPTGTQAAAAASGGAPALVIPPSPSPSMLSLQSGMVLATPEDFAPAAAAAAALVAEHSASRQRSISPTAALADAAQASVAALRSSSRTLGRRLHVLLSPSAGAPSVELGAASPAPAVNTSTQATGSSRASRGSSPLPPLPVAPGAFSPGGARVAVSIYAYAGHPVGADEELGMVHQQQEQQDMAGSTDRSGSHQAISMLDLPGSVRGSEEAAH